MTDIPEQLRKLQRERAIAACFRDQRVGDDTVSGTSLWAYWQSEVNKRTQMINRLVCVGPRL